MYIILLLWGVAFSEMMRRSKGHYNESVVQRCSRMEGAFGKLFHNNYSASVSNVTSAKSATSSHTYTRDIRSLVQDFAPDELFHYITGREHKAFPRYVHSVDLNLPIDLGSKLKDLSRDLSIWRNRAQHHRCGP